MLLGAFAASFSVNYVLTLLSPSSSVANFHSFQTNYEKNIRYNPDIRCDRFERNCPWVGPQRVPPKCKRRRFHDGSGYGQHKRHRATERRSNKYECRHQAVTRCKNRFSWTGGTIIPCATHGEAQRIQDLAAGARAERTSYKRVRYRPQWSRR